MTLESFAANFFEVERAVPARLERAGTARSTFCRRAAKFLSGLWKIERISLA